MHLCAAIMILFFIFFYSFFTKLLPCFDRYEVHLLTEKTNRNFYDVEVMMLRKSIMLLTNLVLIGALSACSVLAQTGLLPTNEAAQPTTAQAERLAPTRAPAGIDETGPADPSLENLQAAYEAIYNQVLPSVVSIEVTQVTRRSLPNLPELPELPFEFELPNQKDGGGQEEYRESGAGSGFVWDEDGHIITNNHVAEGADTIRVRFTDGSSLLAELIGADAASDLAVLKVEAPAGLLQPIPLADSTQAKVGQVVVAIGNPFRLNSSMTTGIISGLGRSLPIGASSSSGSTYTIPDVIQTDAAINPGNSGGVLVDIHGRLVGVTTAIESPVRANSGVGYVIPAAIVQKIVPYLIRDGRYQQPYIGISGRDLTPELAEAMGLAASQRGALVIDVNAGTPAETAGLQGSDRTTEVDRLEARVGGDVIVALDDQTVDDFEDVTAFLARYANVGQTLEVTYLRDGKQHKTGLTLAARPQQQTISAAEEPQPARGGWLGITGADVTPEIAEAMGLETETKGALVVGISAGSPADKAGLRGSFQPFELNGVKALIGGDIITALDGTEVDGISRLVELLGGYEPGAKVKLEFLREGQREKVTVTLGERP